MNSVYLDDDSQNDSLILVDENDQEVGHLSKLECHVGDGLLHRAFSVFLFDPDGRVLLQQRSASKMLWPLHWSNSCCSHPRQGETVEEAAGRRIHEELGVKSELRFLYKFTYQAAFEDVGSENEYCWVFAGRHDGDLKIDQYEIADWRYASPDELTAEIAANGDTFTPWLKMEWQRITDDYLDEILAG